MEHLLNLFIWSLVLLGVVEGILNFPLVVKLQHALLHKKGTYYIMYFLSCKQCFSFWVALALADTTLSPSGSYILDGFLGTGMYILLSTIVGARISSFPRSRNP